MSGSNEPETLKKQRWSIVRKSQVIGTLIGLLFTIGVIVLFTTTPHQTPVDFSIVLMMLTLQPTAIICKVLGLSLKFFAENGGDGSSNQWAIFPLCLVVVINTFLFSLLGTFIGQLIKWKTPNKD